MTITPSTMGAPDKEDVKSYEELCTPVNVVNDRLDLKVRVHYMVGQKGCITSFYFLLLSIALFNYRAINAPAAVLMLLLQKTRVYCIIVLQTTGYISVDLYHIELSVQAFTFSDKNN